MSHGGGVLITVNKNLLNTEKALWNTSVEDIWVAIRFHNFTLNICTFYLPSYLSQADFVEYANKCEQVVMSSVNQQTLIVGDFNLPEINWHESCTVISNSNRKICSLRDFTNRTNHILNNNNKVLDVVYTHYETLCGVAKAQGLSRCDEHHPPLEIIFPVRHCLLSKQVS